MIEIERSDVYPGTIGITLQVHITSIYAGRIRMQPEVTTFRIKEQRVKVDIEICVAGIAVCVHTVYMTKETIRPFPVS